MIAIKIATTGLDSQKDEIIGISICDEEGKYLINTYIEPVRSNHWETSSYNSIKPDEVFTGHFIPWNDLVPVVQDIINASDGVIVYNAQFMIDFMPGISVPCFCDLMPIYAAINGEILETDYQLEFKNRSLEHAAHRFGVDTRNKKLGYPCDSVIVLMRTYLNAKVYYNALIEKGTHRT